MGQCPPTLHAAGAVLHARFEQREQDFEEANDVRFTESSFGA
jgi:hypothetical protein